MIRTPQKAVREVLEKALGIPTGKDQDDFMKGQSFYTLLLDLAVKMKDPVKTFLEFARFTVELGKEADILKIAPDKEGIQTTLKMSGERNIAISPSLEIGPSTKVTKKETAMEKTETTSMQKEEAIEAGVGAKVAAKFDYNNKKGWNLEVPKFITGIKGAKIQANKAEWTINGNREIKIPGEQIGLTSVVNASMIVKLPRDMGTKAEVKVEGRVVREIAFFIDLHGPVRLISPEKLKIPQ